MRVRAMVSCAVVAALAAASGAQAGTPFSLGKGGYPNVAVAPGGDTHLVWVESGFVDGDVLRYCRIPGKSDRCSPFRVGLTPPGDGGRGILRAPHVFTPDASRVVVTESRDGGGGRQAGLFIRTSANGGADFGAPSRMAYVIPHDDAVFGPGESISGVPDGGSPTFGNVALGATGPPANGITRVSLGSGYTADTDVALVDGAPVVAWWQQESGATPAAIYFRRYAGASMDSASLHDSSNWAPQVLVDGTLTDTIDPNSGGELALAAGAGGLYLGHLEAGGDGEAELRVHRFVPGGFDDGTVISRPGSQVKWFALAQDAQGNLHASWEAIGGFYWRTMAGGSWGETRLIATAGHQMRQAQLAPLTVGFGRVFYSTQNSPGSGNVFGATSREAPCVSGDSRPACRPPECERRRNCAVNNWRVDGTHIRLRVKRDGGPCAEDAVTAKVTVGRRGAARIVRVTFALEGSGRRTDQGAPWKADFDVPVSAPGARHRVTAKAFMRSRGRTVPFNMSAPFRVCAEG